MDLDESYEERLKDAWPKECSCGAKYTEEEWEGLRYIGVQKSSYVGTEDLELRSCGHCQSTLAVVGPDVHK